MVLKKNPILAGTASLRISPGIGAVVKLFLVDVSFIAIETNRWAPP
jgi:hypothetical protein